MPIEEIIASIEKAKLSNNYSEARKIALSAVKEHTEDYRIYEELADIYLFEGDLSRASEVLAVARELHPASTTGMYLDGYLATAKGEFQKAIEILTEANKNIPNNPEILRNLGWAYVMCGNFAKGIAILRRAHIIAPEEPMIINDLAVSLIAAGNEDEAQSILSKLGQGDFIDAIKAATP